MRTKVHNLDGGLGVLNTFTLSVKYLQGDHLEMPQGWGCGERGFVSLRRKKNGYTMYRSLGD